MKKTFFVIFIAFLLLLVVLNFYKNNKINIFLEGNIYKSRQTLTLSGVKKINYDEDYAIDVAVIVYNQLYNNEYSYEDFIADDNGRFGTLCWNVRLNPLKDYEQFNGILDESPKGLVISKENGAILANLGE